MTTPETKSSLSSTVKIGAALAAIAGLCLVGWVACRPSAAPQDPSYMAGIAAMEKKAFAEATGHFLKSAMKGHVASQRALGEIYRDGLGLKKDPAKAMEWMTRAAGGGDVEAMYEVGHLHETGSPPDPAAARSAYGKAADAGHAKAQGRLAKMMQLGEGGPADPAKALELFTKAAGAGDPEAQWALGDMLDTGSGGSKDPEGAVTWFTKAASGGHTLSQTILGGMYQQGRTVSKDEAKALEWYRKAAEGGDRYAQYKLGDMLLGSDPKEAMKWLEQGAECGQAEAQHRWGMVLLAPPAGEPDLEKGLKWLEEAATKHEHRPSIRALAEWWRQQAEEQPGAKKKLDPGFSPEAAKAIEWWTVLAKAGEKDAQDWLRSQERTW